MFTMKKRRKEKEVYIHGRIIPEAKIAACRRS
jgi:hypothetical protein